MLPPITTVPAMAVPTAQPTEVAGAPATQFAEKLDVPSLHEGAEFARMVAASDPASIAAAMPQGSDGIASQLMRQLDQITHHLGMLHGGAAAPTGSGQVASPAAANTPDAVHAGMDTALAQMEHAYSFAIETTMASHGSTESTKIFNTLLKGQ